MAAFTTMDALTTLCTSLPKWITRLEELKSQIAERQLELAQREQTQSNTEITDSIRRSRRDSTASLRPSLRDRSPQPRSPTGGAHMATPANLHTIVTLGPTSTTSLPPRSTTTARAKTQLDLVASPSSPSPAPELRTPSVERTCGNTTHGQTSYSSPTTPTNLRKRKPNSMLSGDSQGPKTRQKCMVVVYYDGTVQSTFEDLVKFISVSRNAMRKGKMAAKMAEMRKAAERDVLSDDDDAEGERPGDLSSGSAALFAARRRLAASQAGAYSLGGHDSHGEADAALPNLRLTAVMNTAASADLPRMNHTSSMLNMGLLRSLRRDGRSGATGPDAFDGLDKGLEWCQSLSEQAAHQFLRFGHCSEELDCIKNKLGEVHKDATEKLEKLRKEEAEAPCVPTVRMSIVKNKSRELKTVQMRKDWGTLKDLEVDDTMQVDEDEGFSEELLPPLEYKRSRDRR